MGGRCSCRDPGPKSLEPDEDKGAGDVAVDISETAFVSARSQARHNVTETNGHIALCETSACEVDGIVLKATKRTMGSVINAQKDIAEQVGIKLLNAGEDSPRFAPQLTPAFGRSQSLPAYKSEESASAPTPNTGRSDNVTADTDSVSEQGNSLTPVGGSDKDTLVSSSPASPKASVPGMRARRQSLCVGASKSVAEQSDGCKTPRSQTDRSVSGPSSASPPRPRGERSRISLTAQTALNGPSEALQVIIENPGKITNFYSFKKKVLGKGSYGSVKIATLVSSGARRAIKSIKKKELTHNKAIIEEIQVLKLIDHLHIVKLYETFEDDTTLFLVMALSNHGNMTKHIETFGHLNHDRCKDSMRNLVAAVNYLHNNYITHRDVKPDNVLIHSLNPLSLRLTDFGLAKRFTQKNQVFTSEVGTPCFMAPEVFRKKYTQVADVWSCGITMYFLLCGYLPFTGSTEEEIKQNILFKSPSFSTAEWADVAADTWAFLELMLKKNPRVRYTADQTFHHEWLDLKKARNSDPNSVELSADTLAHLQTFRKGNKLKRSALLVIASMLKYENTLSGHQVFVSLDTNGDGQISLSEMRSFLKTKMKASEVDLMFEQDISLDDDSAGSKAFSYTEFIAATFDRDDCITQAIAKAAFASYDKDGDGRISMEELASGQLLGHLSLEEVSKTLEDLDANGDCFIDFDEFKAMLYT